MPVCETLQALKLVDLVKGTRAVYSVRKHIYRIRIGNMKNTINKYILRRYSVAKKADNKSRSAGRKSNQKKGKEDRARNSKTPGVHNDSAPIGGG